ncbi:MAG TPA: site-2 protease family protein [Thermoanaerobaculia bacterium]
MSGEFGIEHDAALAPPPPARVIEPPLAFPAPTLREWILPAILFAATLASTSFAGLLYAGYGDGRFFVTALTALANPRLLLAGLPFSFTFLSILLAHELGHFFACRYYGIRCTPPFFIPAPISIAGTLGAFIKIKSPFLNKRALFDVGVAGPLAGFAFLLPALVIGIGHSRLIPKGSITAGFTFGEPLLFRWVGALVLGYRPATHDMVAHPIAMAAWFGLLATCLNLLPIWQLDGGHCAYAILGGRVQRRLSVATAFGLVAVSFVGWPVPAYLAFGILLLVVGSRFRFYHPPTLFDDEDLGPGRRLVALLALVILLVSFTPVPFSVS